MGRALGFLAVASFLATTACSGAQPYERAKLAKSKMQLVLDPDAALLEQHVYEYREGSAGGYGAQGGGCGCN